MKAITQYLEKRGFGHIESSYYSEIAYWLKWYKGKVPAFHNYRQFNGRRKINRTRKSLSMAKTVCEDWANLVLNEKVEIVVDNKDLDKKIQNTLESNAFRERGNQLVEVAFALGTGAFVVYLKGDEVEIDYIRADMIFPLTWDNGEITECAFASEKATGKKKEIYLNIHALNDAGNYVIENHCFDRNGNNLTEKELPKGVAETFETNSNTPLFQIIKPNIVNNFDLDSPMGISVFANAIDQVEGCDLVYDSYYNEFRLGKKRVIVPMTMAQLIMEDTGDMVPVFDDNDTEFYAINTQQAETSKIQEINMEIRADAHEKGINKSLGLLSKKCGLGSDRYSFEAGAVKTATEVISDKSDLYQNLQKHELILDRALKNMTKAIAELLGHKSSSFEVNIVFDDSIIEDTKTEKQQDLQEVRDGIMQKFEYRMKWYGESEEDAKKILDEAQSNDDWLGFEGGDA